MQRCTSILPVDKVFSRCFFLLGLCFGPFLLSLSAKDSTLHTAVEISSTIPAPNPDLVCIGQVNVSLQANCQATLTPDKVLLGFSNDLDPTDFSVLVKDGDVSNGGTVDRCGNYVYEVSGPAGFSCWGYVSAQDKEAPQISCPEPVSGYDGKAFVCEDLHEIVLTGVWEYSTDQDGQLLEIPEALQYILDITGYPLASDNCGDLRISVGDVVSDPSDKCGETIITRTFSVKDACQGLTASCTQQIQIGVPTLEDVIRPKELVERSCDQDLKLDAKGNPHPDETGYPTISTAFATYAIDPSFCTLGASYQDGERIDLCESSYKLIRHWQVLDWCNPEALWEFTQIIKVGDYEGPKVSCPEVDENHDGNPDPLVFSSGPYDCTAAFEVPLPRISDNCSGWTVLTEILLGSAEGPVLATVLPGKDRHVSAVPLGCHFLRYTVTDNCGNKTVASCPFFVEDRIAPIAVCNDDLHISLGGEGYARVSATEIGEGSTDNCSSVRLEVRRRIKDISAYDCLDLFDIDGNGVILQDEVRLSVEFGDPDGDGLGDFYYYTQWEEFVDFTCCDMNENVRIELRVWDDRNANGFPGDEISIEDCFNYEQRIAGDNFNVCWLDVLVEDKIAPSCVAPLPVEMDCDELPYDFDPQHETQMTQLFGVATGYDNCPDWTVTELEALTDELNDCHGGRFVRRFQVTDAKGIQSSVCEQLVTIYQIQDYWIKFPADAQANCGTPMVDTVAVGEGACDLLAISVKNETFSASGDECYKIFRTYSVINWCEYDGESDPVVVGRDEDCDGQPGDEAVYVIVKTNKNTDPCDEYYGIDPADQYQHVWYDRDSDPFNMEPKAGTKGESCTYETNPTGFWKEIAPLTENEKPDQDGYPTNGQLHCEIASMGYWQYTQLIKVYDTIKPELIALAPDPFCSFSSDQTQDCPAAVSIDFQVDENCAPNDISMIAWFDADRDGVVDIDITELLSGNYPDFNLSGSFPLGLHDLILTISDGCGNTIQSKIPFEVRDCKAPTPVCINGLAIELMPVIPAVDVDGDGEPDNGAMTIWASDFIGSPGGDCSGEVTYSINRSDELNLPDQTGLILTCKDDQNTRIQIWAYDAVGNADLCETYVMVQDNMVQCPGLTHAAIAGSISTENQEMVQDVQVELSGQSTLLEKTQANGQFLFEDLASGFDYTITPQKDKDPVNGVSTFDLVLMSKHILGVKFLDSPYQLIAADINNDKRITAIDAIALRRLILNIDPDFKNNSSWRFIPQDYQFPDPGNPWLETFPEVINVNALSGQLHKQDFVAIKIGDLNSNAQANAQGAVARKVSGRFALQVADQVIMAGQTYRVDFRAENLSEIQGFQATMAFNSDKLELIDLLPDGILGRDNFGWQFLDEGFLTFSWHQEGTPVLKAGEEGILFSVVLRARTTTSLSQSLQLSSRYTPAEAYDQQDQLLELGLAFGGHESTPVFTLEQNVPNPFRQQTTIGFYLPEASAVSLLVQDAQGRRIKLISNHYARGRHTIKLTNSDLGAAGVLYYTLTSGSFTTTRKMVLME